MIHWLVYNLIYHYIFKKRTNTESFSLNYQDPHINFWKLMQVTQTKLKNVKCFRLLLQDFHSQNQSHFSYFYHFNSLEMILILKRLLLPAKTYVLFFQKFSLYLFQHQCNSSYFSKNSKQTYSVIAVLFKFLL